MQTRTYQDKVKRKSSTSILQSENYKYVSEERKQFFMTSFRRETQRRPRLQKMKLLRAFRKEKKNPSHIYDVYWYEDRRVFVYISNVYLK